MDFESYKKIFLEILNNPDPPEPYDNADYMNYVKLNWSRQERWLKTGILNPELIDAIKNIKQPQLWTIITEPWCGDAAHILPFIKMLAVYNPMVKVDYTLRDSEPFLIDKYLTHGSKSIPKFIIADNAGNDLAVWGPRPLCCQMVYDKLLDEHAPLEQKKIALQKWYNEDKGRSLQLELLSVFSKID
jgi:hypothetical protein